MKIALHLLLSFLLVYDLSAGPATISDNLHIDQFGYRPAAQKVCIISNPINGYNNGQPFSPGSTYHIKRWNDDVTVFSAAIAAWNMGTTHSQSGDKVWWFDFSTLTTPGEYYVYDPTNDVGSYKFKISDDVYSEALKHAVRAFYLQRCGMAKNAAYAGNWADGICHTHSLQDTDCRLVSDPNNPATSKDLSGGWHDAGDYNKYVNFTWSTVHDLLFAYQEKPAVFGDDYGIPESGNGIPDLLDELKWELDWLLKMQQTDGSVLMKVAVPCWEATSPASADLTQRLYGPAQASATRVIASLFAHAAIVYGSLGNPAMSTYANTLLTKAELAWTWISNNPATSSYNNAGFCSANPEMSATDQAEVRTGAAAMLFAATGNTSYRTYFDNNYSTIRPYDWWYFYPFQSTIQDIMLYYASLPGATTSVVNNIKNRCTTSMNSNNPDMLTAWINETDAYRAYLKNGDYVWGSNRWKSNAALIFYNMITYDLYPSNNTHYLNAAENFLHFLHGANPINKLMLTNMNGYGTDNSCNEMYHAWFGDGTNYDNALTSLYGPPPGFLTGGFNPNYAPDGACGCTIAPPQNQPHQKSYKDWNTSWPENSWEITEPAIYSQAAYVKLVSKFAPDAGPLPAVLTSFRGETTTPHQVRLFWSTASEAAIERFEVERSTNGKDFEYLGAKAATGSPAAGNTYTFIDYQPWEGVNFYHLKILEQDGRFEYSKVIAIESDRPFRVDVSPNPAVEFFNINIPSTSQNFACQISLHTFSGEMILQKTIEVAGSGSTERIDLQGYQPGIYFLKIITGSERKAFKIVRIPQ